MDTTNTGVWWTLGIVVVVLILLAAWWASTSGTSAPGIPNTGATTTNTSYYTQ